MIIHKTRQQARQGYADCLEYTVKNAIPLTEEAEEDIKKARKYWIGAKQGKSFEQIKREENNGKLAKLNQENNRKFAKN